MQSEFQRIALIGTCYNPPQKTPQTNKTENKKQNKALLLTLFMNEYSKLGPPTVKNCM